MTKFIECNSSSNMGIWKNINNHICFPLFLQFHIISDNKTAKRHIMTKLQAYRHNSVRFVPRKRKKKNSNASMYMQFSVGVLVGNNSVTPAHPEHGQLFT